LSNLGISHASSQAAFRSARIPLQVLSRSV
jgi:hypothetical protein